MLHVDARVGASRIHGLGLIAQQPIAAGTTVWTLEPGFDRVLTEAEFRALSPPARRTVLYYASFDPRRRVFVLSGDDDRFTNHSVTPNTRMVGERQTAVVDIAPGEEITVDYRELGWTAFCGAPPGTPPPPTGDGLI